MYFEQVASTGTVSTLKMMIINNAATQAEFYSSIVFQEIPIHITALNTYTTTLHERYEFVGTVMSVDTTSYLYSVGFIGRFQYI